MIDGSSALVVGLGVSGHAAAAALAGRSWSVRVADESTSPTLEARAAELRALGVEVALGTDLMDPALRAGAEVIVASPGVRPSQPVLVAAERDATPVWSEPELAWRLAGGEVHLVGVTGTNGKTTTTALVAACLDIPAAGNIGTPLVTLLDADPPPPQVAAELSSFQLHYTDALHAHVAVLLNVAPDHLDWHGDLGAYVTAKSRLWRRQGPDDALVVVVDDPGACEAVEAHPPAGRSVPVTLGPAPRGGVGIEDGRVVARIGTSPEPVVAVADLRLTGPHNLQNVCAATAAALCAGASADALSGAVRAATAGAHRLEHVATWDGVDWVDDSKATNPHAAAAALSAFDRVVWIAGGLDKGLDFAPLGPLITERVRHALLIGSSGPKLTALVRAMGVPATQTATLEQAVDVAAEIAQPGDTVLLAPACASMDQFVDYAERGRRFREAVRGTVPEGVGVLGGDATGDGNGAH